MRLSSTELSLEEQLHGGFLHLARAELSQRIDSPQPSLYDCLLASIYFRKTGDQRQALAVLDLHRSSSVFDATYNRLQSLCHTLDFEQALSTAQAALTQWSANWGEQQRGYVEDLCRTTAALADPGGIPTGLHHEALDFNSYHNLNSGEITACTGVVDGNRRLSRPVAAFFDPHSQCWLEQNSGRAIPELLQPNHDFRSFFGGARPWQIGADTSASAADASLLEGISIVVESNPHFGHFLTQSASFANALGYTEQLVSKPGEEITVLSKGSIPDWAQRLMQASCSHSLRFQPMDPDQPLRATCLVVAPPTWIEWHYIHRDHARLFRQAARHWLKPRSSTRRRLYFSRSHLGECLRRSVNEEALETLLVKRGFSVVHPQQLPLPEVVQLVNEAELIAGAMGSAMHNVLFCLPDQPLTTLNFAHHLPGINNALVERCSGIRNNLYRRSCTETDAAPGEASHLEFLIDDCLEGVDQALAQLEQRS
jgi:capsular polysaccharide biosynthesis protein